MCPYTVYCGGNNYLILFVFLLTCSEKSKKKGGEAFLRPTSLYKNCFTSLGFLAAVWHLNGSAPSTDFLQQ